MKIYNLINMLHIHKKDILYLASLISIASLVHLFYFYHAPGIIMSEDSYGYYEVGNLMLSKKIFVNDMRTPVYPVFLSSVVYLLGGFAAPVFSPKFLSGMHTVIYVQIFLGIFALVLLYFLLLNLNFKRLVAFIFSLFIAFDILLFSWERLIMTESLTIVWLIILSFILVKTVKKPKKKYFCLLFFLFSFGFLLRPIYAALPVLIIPLIIIYHRKKEILITGSLTVLACFFLVFFYTYQNKIHYRYNGLSRISDINLLGVILKFDLPIEAGKKYQTVYTALSQYKKLGLGSSPWTFTEKYPEVFYGENVNRNELKDFNQAVITSNLPAYLFKSLLIFPSAMLETYPKIILVPASKGFLPSFYQLLFYFYKNMQYLTFLIFPFILVTTVKFLKKPNVTTTVMMILGVIILYQICLSVFFSYWDFGRLIAPIQPEIYLFLFLFLNLLKKIPPCGYTFKKN